MSELIVSDWKLIRLTLEDLGPFRQGQQVFNFFGVDTEQATPTGAGPSNLYMLLARNGHGKTTVLETIYGLFALMNEPASGRFASFPSAGRAQVDIRATWVVDGKSRAVLLSLWTGSEHPIVSWTTEELSDIAECDVSAKLGLNASSRGVAVAAGSDELGRLFYGATQAALGKAPTDLFGLSQLMPTILYFPADRRVVAPSSHEFVTRPDHWGYEAAQIFGSDGPEWGSSIDNVLVWLEWVGGGRTDELLRYLNEQIFKDDRTKTIRHPLREELRTFVETLNGSHPLAALSHGERAMLQILGRTLTHMTSNTIILIDEIEIHLHTRWMNRMFEALKQLLRDYKSLSIIFTTHNRELIHVFRPKEREDGLVKGGYLIEDEIQ